MNFKRYIANDNSWVDSHYIMGTDTDTITTLPTVIYPNDTSITVGIKGQSSQSGTPSPQNPVDVNGTGERSSNLLATLTENYAIDASGNINSNSFFMYYTAPCEANKTYTFSLDSGLSGNTVRIHAFNGNTWIEQLSGKNINLAPFTVTTPANTTNLKISITKDAKTYHTMLNVGETALPYEPYGYKIPISSAGQTTPVYLGEVQTERKIQKVVLTGQEEGWIKQDSLTATDAYQNYNLTSDYLRTEYIVTHMPVNSSIADTSTHGYIGQRITLCMNKALSLSTVDLFKTWLADEYSAGHPVILYYVLATPQTAVANEPLMKIGTYTDTLTTSIPVTAGENTLDVQTTVQPSEVTANYQGWHPVSAAHERENGQWD
jgi:hypothetical protein